MIPSSVHSPILRDIQNTVVAIGNFDGTHRGHQILLSRARDIATKNDTSFLVLTFDPHPRRFFRPDSPPFLITDPVIKNEQLYACGADHVVRIPFDTDLANLDPSAFIDQILKDRMRAGTIVIGADFHFGHNRAGNADTLRTAGFNVINIPLILDHAGIPISSTRIRSLLQEGRVEDASNLLGSAYTLRGIVKRGDQRGRVLGYPTANIDFGDILAPAHGIYAAFVDIEGQMGPAHRAAANIGHRPMFHTPRVLLEAHLLDFSADLYGKTLRVRLVQKLRDEARFDTIDGLTDQMKKDCDSARKLLELSIQQTNIL